MFQVVDALGSEAINLIFSLEDCMVSARAQCLYCLFKLTSTAVDIFGSLKRAS